MSCRGIELSSDLLHDRRLGMQGLSREDREPSGVTPKLTKATTLPLPQYAELLRLDWLDR